MFVLTCKNISSFYQFTLEIQQISEFHDVRGYTYVWPELPKNRHSKQIYEETVIKNQEWMPNNATHHGWVMVKKLNIRCAQMAYSSLFQTFCFQVQLYFTCFFFQKLSQKIVFSFSLPLINSDNYIKNPELLSVLMFSKNILNKFPTVYSRIELYLSK